MKGSHGTGETHTSAPSAGFGAAGLSSGQTPHVHARQDGNTGGFGSSGTEGLGTSDRNDYSAGTGGLGSNTDNYSSSTGRDNNYTSSNTGGLGSNDNNYSSTTGSGLGGRDNNYTSSNTGGLGSSDNNYSSSTRDRDTSNIGLESSHTGLGHLGGHGHANSGIAGGNHGTSQQDEFGTGASERDAYGSSGIKDSTKLGTSAHGEHNIRDTESSHRPGASATSDYDRSTGPNATGNYGDQQYGDKTGEHKVGMMDKIKGTAEKATGKMTGNPDLVERGEERKDPNSNVGSSHTGFKSNDVNY